MVLKATHDTLEEIPEAHRELYTERGGKFELTGIEGVKTQADIDRLNRGLTSERDAHKLSKAKLEGYLNLGDAEELQAKLDRIAELEAAAGGKLDETKLNELVEGRLRTKTAPLEREKAQLIAQNAEKDTKIEAYEARERQRVIHDVVRTAASKSKMHEHALEDALLLAERVLEVDEQGNVTTKDGVGVTPGISPEVWLQEMAPKRPHWWPESGGGGGRGNPGGRGGHGGNNPFTAEHWNMTEQGRVYSESPERAAQLAQSAGTTVGGQRPAPRK